MLAKALRVMRVICCEIAKSRIRCNLQQNQDVDWSNRIDACATCDTCFTPIWASFWSPLALRVKGLQFESGSNMSRLVIAAFSLVLSRGSLAMLRWFYILPHLLIEANAARRDARIRFLKAQVEILRRKL